MKSLFKIFILRHRNECYLNKYALKFAITSFIWAIFGDSLAYSKEKRIRKKLKTKIEETAYLGFESGYLHSISSDESKEFSKKGYSLGLFLVGGKAFDSIIFEITLGWRSSRLLVGEKKEFEGVRNLEIQSNYFHLDLAPLFNINPGVWWSPLASIALGADTSFSPNEENQRTSVLIGAQALLSTGKHDLHRFSAQLITDLSIQNRQIIFFNLNYQMGVTFRGEGNPKRKVIFKTKRKIIYKTKEKVVYKPKERVIYKPVDRVIYKSNNGEQFVIDAGVINFETGKSSINDRHRSYLRELGKLLKKDTKKWNSIEIRSHTDIRGSKWFNQELSKSRADAVVQVLQGYGINSNKLKVISSDFEDPISQSFSPDDFAKNRRVEITLFSNQNHGAQVYRMILKLRQKHLY